MEDNSVSEFLGMDMQRASNSGDKIDLVNVNQKVYVKKTSVKNIKRVKSNLNKQKSFSNFGNIHSVDVTIKESVNKINATMPYIKGLVGEDYAKNGKASDILKLSSHLGSYFEFIKEKSSDTSMPSKLINNKISDTVNGCYDNDFISGELKNLSDNLSKQLIIKEKNFIIPISQCHGDFTLSNIIYGIDKNIYLIDFLDTFINSFLIDYAKLLQDTVYCWSVRNADRNAIIKHKIFGKIIMNNIDIPHYRITDTLIKLNILRIVPYCYNLNTEKWLINTMKAL